MIICLLLAMLCLTPDLCFGHAETDSLGIHNPVLHGHALNLLRIGDVQRINLITNGDSIAALYIVCDSIRVADASLALVSRSGCAITATVTRRAITGPEGWGLGNVVREHENGAFFAINPRWRARIIAGLPVRFVLLTENNELAAGVFHWKSTRFLTLTKRGQHERKRTVATPEHSGRYASGCATESNLAGHSASRR